jgi:splicing factor 3B subunit 1
LYIQAEFLFLLTDIEAQIREIQSRKKEVVVDENGDPGVGLGESGFYDRDIYGGGGKFEGYVTSIAANDEVDVSYFYSLFLLFITTFMVIY